MNIAQKQNWDAIEAALKTPQDAFDFAVNHLLVQGRTSTNNEMTAFETFICVYRAKDGAKCVVGAFIPDVLYTEALEYNNSEELPREVLSQHGGDVLLLAEEWVKAYGKYGNMWVALQAIHDETLPENWEASLAEYADIQKLQFNPPVLR